MPFDPSIIGKPTDKISWTYSWKDVVAYALGIGAKRDELDYLYEGRGPRVYPSFAVVPKFNPMLDLLVSAGGNLAMVVHGGERVRIHRPFTASGVLRTSATIRGVYDMRKFATILVDTESTDENGELVATTSSSIIYRGEGGWGGDPPPKENSGIVVPKGTPSSFRIEEKTSEEQALLYRLSGDYNPLHADPEFASRVGFPQGPILHGLCTFGYMTRHVAKGVCDGNASRIQAFEAQFRRPVWPGDTLVTEGWVVRPGEVALQVSVKERGELVFAGASARFEP